VISVTRWQRVEGISHRFGTWEHQRGPDAVAVSYLLCTAGLLLVLLMLLSLQARLFAVINRRRIMCCTGVQTRGQASECYPTNPPPEYSSGDRW
jgi:hypothetical protein